MSKTLIRKCVVLPIMLAVLSSVSWQAVLAAPKSVEYRRVMLNKVKYKESHLYKYRKEIYFSFNHYYGEAQDDYGKQFGALKKVNNTFRLFYISKGSSDAYNLSPTFFSKNKSNTPLLILAEIGTEYSWGVRVFLITKGLQIIDLGMLEVAVIPEVVGAENPDTAIPFTRIHETEGKIYFTFTRDVIFDPGGRNEKNLKNENIRYVYDGKTLKEEIKPVSVK